MKSDYEEVSILTDDDLSTCETGKNTMDLFGLFLEHHLQRIIVSLVGHDMCCSPANGIMVTVVSTSQESKICQATFSHYSDRCRYRCFCVNTVTYSHIAIRVPANGNNICEIIIDWFEIRLHILKEHFVTRHCVLISSCKICVHNLLYIYTLCRAICEFDWYYQRTYAYVFSAKGPEGNEGRHQELNR